MSFGPVALAPVLSFPGWAEWRDIMIVILGIFWLIALLLVIILLVLLVMLVMLVRRILKENAAPALDSLKASLDNVRGTTEFAGETVVSPIIRTYAIVKGVRSGVGAITHLPSMISRRKKGRK